MGPWLTGSLSETLGNSAHSLRLALSITIPLGLVGAGALWVASRNVELGRDQLAQSK